MSNDDLARIVFDAFEQKFGWRPDDLDFSVAPYIAASVCERMGVPVPALAYPVLYHVFADALGAPGGAAPATPPGLPEVSSEGGPLLVISTAFAASWRGTDGPAPTDYDRCCEPSEAYRPTAYGGLDWVEVGSGRALVLDLELPTTAMLWGKGAVVVRNGVRLPTEEQVAGWMAAAAWTPFEGKLTVPDGRLALFDSATPGAAEPEAIESAGGVIVLDLAAGLYGVAVAEHDGVELIRLLPLP